MSDEDAITRAIQRPTLAGRCLEGPPTTCGRPRRRRPGRSGSRRRPPARGGEGAADGRGDPGAAGL